LPIIFAVLKPRLIYRRETEASFVVIIVTVCVAVAIGKVDSCSDDRNVYLNDQNVPRCSRKSWLALVLFLIYILMTGIMLINLLIAIFRFVTYNSSSSNSNRNNSGSNDNNNNSSSIGGNLINYILTISCLLL